MGLNAKVCYRAVQARDSRYDGRFFTCVKTTGIYCRPICPARPPKAENCTFVPTAAAAQEAGYRPCLRCRPESSPELDAWRGTEATVSRALKLIEAGALDSGNVATLSDRLEIGERQLPPLRKNCESLDYHELLAQMVRVGCGACIIEFGPEAIEQKRFMGIAFDVVIFGSFDLDIISGRGAALVQF